MSDIIRYFRDECGGMCDNCSKIQQITCNEIDDGEFMNADREWKIVEDSAKEFRDKYPDWRHGQSLFNALHIHDALIANTIRGTKYDCFNSDARIEIFKARAIELFKSR